MSEQKLFGTDKVSKVDFYEYCVLGKQHRLKFKAGNHEAKAPLDYIHSDLQGLEWIATHGGNTYFLSIVNDFTSKVWIYLLKNKNDALTKFKQWKILIENITNFRVKTLRIDNGLEFCNEVFNNYCNKNGIQRHRTIRMTPQKNGVAERMNRTLLNKARCMLFSLGLPKSFWGEAMMTAAYLVNKSPFSAIKFKTPKEKWNGNPPNITHLRAFGCTAYAHQKEGKLDPRALKYVFLGYPQGVKGYRLWVKDGKGFKTIISRDVIFNENEFPCLLKTNQNARKEPNDTNPAGTVRSFFEVELILNQTTQVEPTRVQSDQQQSVDNPDDRQHELIDDEEQEPDQESDHHSNSIADYQFTRDREKRVIKLTQRYGHNAFSKLLAYAFMTVVDQEKQELESYQKAINGKESDKWLATMKEEMNSLYKNQTQIMVKRLQNQSIVACKWIFKLKEGTIDNEPVKYKARLVAKWFTQKKGIDFTEIFSPVVKYKTIRIMLSLIVQFNLEVEQMDVKTTFLHDEFEQIIYIEQAEGFEIHKGKNMLCLLKRSLYGLKQSPRQWNKWFDSLMIQQGFNMSFIMPVYTLNELKYLRLNIF